MRDAMGKNIPIPKLTLAPGLSYTYIGLHTHRPHTVQIKVNHLTPYIKKKNCSYRILYTYKRGLTYSSDIPWKFNAYNTH